MPVAVPHKKNIKKRVFIRFGKAKLMENEELLLPNGKMYFYTNDKKEGEGTWGMNSSKTGFFVISGGGTEQWIICLIDEKELLVEMDGLKMLLSK
jgi:hypothetical protein